MSTPASAARAFIGISGWRYPPWRGVFYPEGLRQKSELSYASRAFSSIEVNGSFYSLLRPQTYQSWYDETLPGFTFSLKGGRYITPRARAVGEEDRPMAPRRLRAACQPGIGHSARARAA